MSTVPNLLRSTPTSRAVDSPRSPPLSQPGHPVDDEGGEQPPADDAPEDDIPYLEPSSEQTLLPPPNFRPFFTLIDDTTSGEQYHPYVHYIFADDDPIIVTAASMRGLGMDDAKYLPQEAVENDERRSHEEEGDDPQDLPLESPLPPPIPGVREHYLIIDVGTDGRTIVDAQSLSSEWQITSTDIRTAPSFDENAPDQGYMLRVEGVEIAKNTKGKGKGQTGQGRLSFAREQNQGDIFGALDSLVHGIEGSLEITGKISGPKRTECEESIPTDILQEQVE